MALLKVLGVSLVIVWGLAGGLSYFVYVRGGELDDTSDFDAAMAQRCAAEVVGFVILFAVLYGLHGVIWPLAQQTTAAFDSKTLHDNQSTSTTSQDDKDSGGIWARASWRAKWANRIVAGLHGIVSSVWAIMVLRALSMDAMAACSNERALSTREERACGAEGSAAWLLPSGVSYDTPRNRYHWWTGGVLEFTLAYSVYDLAYMALLEPGAAFMLHHVAIMSCFAPLFWVDRGYVVAVLGIAIAEIANPLLGVWTWAKENLKSNAASSTSSSSFSSDVGQHLESERLRHQSTFERLSLPVTLAYTLTRGVVMPLSLIDVALIRKPTPVLAWVWVHCVFGFLGSLAWIQMLVAGYLKFRSKGSGAGIQKKRIKVE